MTEFHTRKEFTKIIKKPFDKWLFNKSFIFAKVRCVYIWNHSIFVEVIIHSLWSKLSHFKATASHIEIEIFYSFVLGLGVALW